MLTGGCQCGAVRFRLEADPRSTSLCHCRMCQKQFAAPFGAFGSWAVGDIVWTRGVRTTFRSSEHIARGFCGDCGTPMTFEPVTAAKHVAIAVCTLDDPAALTPQRQIGLEGRLPWLDQLNDLPRLSDAEISERAARHPPVVSRQHPDYETTLWPPAERGA
jgi:hypothetical protein